MTNGPGTRLYRIWKGMKGRCQTPSSSGYPIYGARGIKVCQEWQTFVGFLDWALLHDYASNLQIDRIDVDGPYAPYNCRWVSTEINIGRQSLDRDGAYLSSLNGRLDDAIVMAASLSGKAKLYDGDGLFLVRTKTGFSWRYRFVFEGREQSFTLGRYPEVKLSAARELALIAKKRVAAGRHPSRVRADNTARSERARATHRGTTAQK